MCFYDCLNYNYCTLSEMTRIKMINQSKIIFFRGCVPKIVSCTSRESWVLFRHYCTLSWCAKIIVYIMARLSYSFVRTLYYLIIANMQTYLKVFNFPNACQVLQCVSKIISILTTISIIFHIIHETVCIQPAHLSCDDCENTIRVLIILLSSPNLKH